ncbi:MAG: 3-dehydroquinate synthase [Legionellaceae bacterium]|nr:3-dehydroquinate synthase [Legionellaceae bacterium]
MVSLKSLQKVDVKLSKTCYSIVIGRHLLEDAAHFSALIQGSQVLIVTNETIAPLYLDKLCQSLQKFQCDVVILPDGEAYKNQESITRIHEALIRYQHHRDTTLIALGGGVIGDITGFAASTYHRGVALIQCPTTLLAMVDASVGGKTAINHPQAKNVIGSFYQPSAVLIDLVCLETLHPRERQAGFAEIIKYALLSGDLSLSSKPLPELVAACCRIKAAIVEADAEDKVGVRALLNLGHTFAHALETYTHYKRWLHGEAVAIGLYCAAKLSHQLGHLDVSIVQQVDDLLALYELPRRMPRDIQWDALYQLMQQDKKATHGKIPFVLMKALGQCYLDTTVTKTQIQCLLTDDSMIQ